MYDYGELSDMGEPESSSQMPMSNMDMLEEKARQDGLMINEAVDEFIKDKKLWFRDLHRDHKGEIDEAAGEKAKEFLENTALHLGRTNIPVDGQLDPEGEEVKKILKERTVMMQNKIEEELANQDSDLDEEEEDDSDPEDKWDADTILSTYTNTDNHPSVIKFQKKVKVN
mmetsp:Transcript_29458/g.44646  ORF Transcript_29458/g.44646 Transcript_29458/m.44646 type:complete len:170 (+) Transcript_29458:1595-2104(+)